MPKLIDAERVLARLQKKASYLYAEMSMVDEAEGVRIAARIIREEMEREERGDD